MIDMKPATSVGNSRRLRRLCTPSNLGGVRESEWSHWEPRAKALSGHVSSDLGLLRRLGVFDSKPAILPCVLHCKQIGTDKCLGGSNRGVTDENASLLGPVRCN